MELLEIRHLLLLMVQLLNVNDIITIGNTTGNVTNVAVEVAEKGQRYKVLAINTHVLTIERYPSSNAVGLKTAVAGATNAVEVNRYWQYFDQFDKLLLAHQLG